MSKKDINVTSHRGAAGLAPENTLSSIKKALEYNVDRIEIDVQQTKDFVIVVLHNKTLEKTTNGEGKIIDLTYGEISKYSAGIKFDKKYENEKIPTLEQVLKLVNGNAKLIIEIKYGGDYYPDIENRIVRLIKKYNATDWCIIHSLDDKVLEKVHSIDEEIVLHKLFLCKLPFVPILIDNKLHMKNIEKYNYIDEFSVLYIFATKELVDKIHRMNKRINVWTVNDRKQIGKLINLGVDGIMTDYPNYLKDR